MDSKMTVNETNIIEFKKPTKEPQRDQGKQVKTIYDSVFTPELHQQLLKEARKENGSN